MYCFVLSAFEVKNAGLIHVLSAVSHTESSPEAYPEFRTRPEEFSNTAEEVTPCIISFPGGSFVASKRSCREIQ